jgi:hypothetical protein
LNQFELCACRIVEVVQYETNMKSRRHRIAVLSAIALVSIALVGCSRRDTGRATAPLMLRAAQASSASSTLSREHTVVVDIPEMQLEAGFRRVSDRCTSDTADHCTILQSDLSSGDAPSGLIKLPIDPEGVELVIGLAVAQGKLERRSTRVEDLTDAIADTHTRIEMLTSYRKQLLELRAKAGSNVDAAIKGRLRIIDGADELGARQR